MADLTFASFLQGPLGEAIVATDTLGLLPPPALQPHVELRSSAAPPERVPGPPIRLLGPEGVAGLASGTVVRTDPPAGAVDVEPNYMAIAEVVPAELPWILTPARAAGGRLRPWLVLVVLEEAAASRREGSPLPVVDAPIEQLPDLGDSWGWAHVQRVAGAGTLAAGSEVPAPTVARLVCPRRLAAGVRYRACLVPAFASGVAAGLGDPDAGTVPHDLAWRIEDTGTVALPVLHEWTFRTGPSGDFEALVSRLRPADPEALRVASVRPVDVRAPWPGDEALAADAQVVGVQGALVPFDAPPVPEAAASAPVLVELDRRLRAHLDAPAQRLAGTGAAAGTAGSLAPPLYGGRHVCQDLVGGDPAWLAQLNTSVANRIAAGLGAEYVRVNQEDLMAKAWRQVGAIRELNRLRAVAELTSKVAEKVHERHVAPLSAGEAVALAAPASARTRTSAQTTLAMETRMSRMADGVASTAFARRVRPAGKVARRTGVRVDTMIPRALSGEVAVPAGAPVIPEVPAVVAGGVTEVASEAAARQLVAMTALAQVAAVNHAGAGGAALEARLGTLGLGGDVATRLRAGSVRAVAAAIAGQVDAVARVTKELVGNLSTGDEPVSVFGVPIADAELAGRLTEALRPGDSHHARLASQAHLPDTLVPPRPGEPVMACPDFPVPTALALQASDPEWLIPGLGALPADRVALLRPNPAFIESYLVGMNHELMRELLWREYPTDQRGTAFTRFWPRPDGTPDIPGIAGWTDAGPLGSRAIGSAALAVLLVRGEVVRRYPGMVVTAVRSAGPAVGPDGIRRHRPDPGGAPEVPVFVVGVDQATTAYAFAIPRDQLEAPATDTAPGWFFVFAEHGFRIRFGFDEPPPPEELPVDFTGWEAAAWPSDAVQDPAFVPVERGHAKAGAAFAAPPGAEPQWNRDAADIARITLQRPFRVAVQADVLLGRGAPA